MHQRGGPDCRIRSLRLIAGLQQKLLGHIARITKAQAFPKNKLLRPSNLLHQ
jgi:hypothetical protein